MNSIRYSSAGMEHRVIEQAARISHAEQKVNEEYAFMCQAKQNADTAMRQEIDQLAGERNTSYLKFMEETKEAGALRRELLRKDERILQLINSPDDGEKKKSRDAVDAWQKTCAELEQKNESLRVQLADQESFVEQLNGALVQKDEEMKAKAKEILKPAASVTARKSQWGVITDEIY